ncbi:RRQRL motif-containing zinc-binding protein (plasmid) [Streptomyces sp. QH1-20]|uniref:RRQRL motif-containing zinc-binding protein n=1 Tax=Streptomyces sp. QH1-20 TaxID=3240934 RepID=UPI003516F6BB
MADQDQDLVDIDPNDPGDGSIPVFRWRQAGHTNLATRRQLREMGLRPGGHEPVARIECRGGKRWAWLYEIDKAKPIRPMTVAKEAALDKAMAKRQTCPSCSRRYYHCLPLKSLGSCLECYDGTPAELGSYLRPPGEYLAAAA